MVRHFGQKINSQERLYNNMSVFITLLNYILRADMVNFVICLKSQEEEIKISQTNSRIIFTDVWPFKLYHYNCVFNFFSFTWQGSRKTIQ